MCSKEYRIYECIIRSKECISDRGISSRLSAHLRNRCAAEIEKGELSRQSVLIYCVPRVELCLLRNEYRDLTRGIINVRHFPRVDGRIICTLDTSDDKQVFVTFICRGRHNLKMFAAYLIKRWRIISWIRNVVKYIDAQCIHRGIII